MGVGIVGDDMMVRVGPCEYDRALNQAHVRQMDFTGSPTLGYTYVEPEGCHTETSLRCWSR